MSDLEIYFTLYFYGIKILKCIATMISLKLIKIKKNILKCHNNKKIGANFKNL